MSDQPPSKGNDNLDDIFHPLDDDTLPPISTGPSSGSVPPISTAPTSGSVPPVTQGYIPPSPSQQRSRPPAILYIVLGAALAVLCLCGACFAVFGAIGVNVANNPTVRANMVTVQAVLGTASTMFQMPPKLPKGNHSAGTISAGETQSGTLVATKSDVWQLQGSNGQHVTVTVTSQHDDFVPMIGLYGGDGNLIAKSGLSGSDRVQTLDYTLKADGTYNILVASLMGVPGSYDIKVSGGSQ